MNILKDDLFIKKILWVNQNSLVNELLDQSTYLVLTLLHYKRKDLLLLFKSNNILKYISKTIKDWICDNNVPV